MTNESSQGARFSHARAAQREIETSADVERAPISNVKGRQMWAHYMGQDFARYLGLNTQAVLDVAQSHPDHYQRAVANAVVRFLDYLGWADHDVDETARFSAPTNSLDELRRIRNGEDA